MKGGFQCREQRNFAIDTPSTFFFTIFFFLSDLKIGEDRKKKDQDFHQIVSF